MFSAALLLVALSAPTPDATFDAGGKGLSKRKDRKWIRRWAPEKNMVELGVYGGLIFPAADLELFETDPNRPQQGFLRFESLGPEVGGRVGYYPIPYFGIEAEGGYAPIPLRDFGVTTAFWAARGHFVGQLGWWSVTPFVLFGAGVLSVVSDDFAVGNDVDQALHLGFGSKFFINRYVMARVELRDIITPRRGVGSAATNTLELLVGLSVTLGRERDRDTKRPPEPTKASDRDGDGVLDLEDSCPDDPGDKPTGCPDTDADGIVDLDDRCPEKAGDPPTGCPDTDADGFLDPDDACPEVAGIDPDGCPEGDPDKDGIAGDADACPNDPETFNGFEDEDGCPDTLPDDLDQFSGAIEGVQFKLGSAKLLSKSQATLDQAVQTLDKYKAVRVEISGHTDSTGNRDHNMDLSRQRAETVKAYLVDRGIVESRITTRGAGPDEPVDTNKTAEGRAQNRRIEFRILE